MESLELFEQKLEDLRQEEQQLLVVINKGIPEDPENYLTWRYCNWKLNEIRKIQNLERARQTLSTLL